jgi:hypothetical protein
MKRLSLCDTCSQTWGIDVYVSINSEPTKKNKRTSNTVIPEDLVRSKMTPKERAALHVFKTRLVTQ